jgi:ribosomal 30S subunit maturation factor RimM
MYVVETKNGEVLMPGVSEIVREVNVNEKIIRVVPPEGLFDGEMM